MSDYVHGAYSQAQSNCKDMKVLDRLLNSEKSRVLAEKSRVEAEEARKSAETQRVAAQENRVDATIVLAGCLTTENEVWEV